MKDECFNFATPLSIHCFISIYVIVIKLIEPLKCHDTVNIGINVKRKTERTSICVVHQIMPFKSAFVARYTAKAMLSRTILRLCVGGDGWYNQCNKE